MVAAIGSVFIENKRPTRQSFFSLLMIVCGVGLAVWKGSSAGEESIVGIILCLFGRHLHPKTGLLLYTSFALSHPCPAVVDGPIPVHEYMQAQYPTG